MQHRDPTPSDLVSPQAVYAGRFLIALVTLFPALLVLAWAVS